MKRALFGKYHKGHHPTTRCLFLVDYFLKGILNSIEKRTEFTENVLGLKMLHKKRNCTTFLKSYRNSLNKIASLSKADHYKTFFEDNKNKLNKGFGRYLRDQHQQKKKHPAN